MRGQLLFHHELWGTLPQATHLRKLIYLLRKTNTLLCKPTIKLYTNYISFTINFHGQQRATWCRAGCEAAAAQIDNSTGVFPEKLD